MRELIPGQTIEYYVLYQLEKQEEADIPWVSCYVLTSRLRRRFAGQSQKHPLMTSMKYPSLTTEMVSGALQRLKKQGLVEINLGRSWRRKYG